MTIEYEKLNLKSYVTELGIFHFSKTFYVPPTIIQYTIKYF